MSLLNVKKEYRERILSFILIRIKQTVVAV